MSLIIRQSKLLTVVILSLLLILPEGVCASDATSFDPLPVTIKAQSGGVPIGTVIAWPAASNPPDGNWLECNGQSTAGYPELAAVIGGAVPNYSGMFLRGYGSQAITQNNGSSVGTTSTTHSSGSLGASQGDAMRAMFKGEILGSRQVFRGASGVFTAKNDIGGNHGPARDGDWSAQSVITFDPGQTLPTATEIRPANKAVRYFIRAKS